MASIFTAVLFFLTLKSATSKLESRIVGGKPCNITDYPFFVTLIIDRFCAGTLISSEWVLTAAHCFVGRRPGVETELRTGHSSLPTSVEIRQAKTHLPHPEYSIFKNGSDRRFDIGLVRADRPFGAAPARLPSGHSCEIGRVVGIGLSFFEEKFPGIPEYLRRPLKCVDLPIVDSSPYVEIAKIDRYSVITTYSIDEGSCRGDSGGPLLCDGDVVIGVTSFGNKCGAGPGFYSNVEFYKSWILSSTKLELTTLPSNVTGNSGISSDGHHRNVEILLFCLWFCQWCFNDVSC